MFIFVFILCYVFNLGGKMNSTEYSMFKKKYFTHNFYWVNKENYKRLQEIALEMGCLCHTGKKVIIEWHDGFNNLGFRTYPEYNGITRFQKQGFLCDGDVATDYNDMISEYDKFR